MATLASSGALSLNQISILLGQDSGTEISLGENKVQNLLLQTSGVTSIDDFYGVELAAPYARTFLVPEASNEWVRYTTTENRTEIKDSYNLTGFYNSISTINTIYNATCFDTDLSDSDHVTTTEAAAFADEFGVTLNGSKLSSSYVYTANLYANSVQTDTNYTLTHNVINGFVQYRVPLSEFNSTNNVVGVTSFPKSAYVYEGDTDTLFSTSICEYRGGMGWTTDDYQNAIRIWCLYDSNNSRYQITIFFYLFPRGGLTLSEWIAAADTSYTNSNYYTVMSHDGTSASGTAGIKINRWMKTDYSQTFNNGTTVGESENFDTKQMDVDGSISSFNTPSAGSGLPAGQRTHQTVSGL